MLPTDSEIIGAFANASTEDVERRNRACAQLAPHYLHVVKSFIPWYEAIDAIHEQKRDTPRGVIAEQLLKAHNAGKLIVQLSPQGQLVFKFP